MVEVRSESVRKLLMDRELDALVLCDLASIRYLSGFTGSDGALVVTADGQFFLTDSRYTTQAEEEVRALAVRTYRVKLDGILDLLADRKARRVGFEAETLSYATVRHFREKGPVDCDWVPLEKELAPLRGVKGGSEIEAMRAAARLNAEAFEEILPRIRPGVSEREIALELEFALKRRGGEEKAFDFIVASGARGALPHGVASNKVLRTGELVTIDFGTRVAGYHSDETVTVALGEVAPQLREIYDVVLKAHDLAIARIRPGVSLKELDSVARRHIAACGYGDCFGHGLGHGVGLQVHEYPTVSSRSEAVAEPGMVFTVEPGIYLPEVGGVRIEDMVEVIDDGCRPLTQIPKAFRTLPA